MFLALDGVNQYFLSIAALFLMIFAGSWFLVHLRAFYLFHPVKTLRALPFASGAGEMWRSLGGAVGVGNIFGVAAAVTYGGAGALFWMWAGAFFSMGIKYAEITLGMLPHACGGRGAVGYIFDAFGRGAALLFALLLWIESVLMGGMLQSRAVSEAAMAALRLPPAVCGLVLCGLLVLACAGPGAEKKLASVFVPPACGGYILLCAFVILRHIDGLPHVLSEILRGAFTPCAPLGIFGTPALRQGIAKGIFSNEAGCGTAPTAHQGAKGTTPAVQGLFGIFEVFVDTLLLCTATGFAILLTAGERLPAYRGSAAQLTTESFGDLLGGAAPLVIFIFVFLFAAETLVAFFGYSRQMVKELSLPPAFSTVAAGLFFLLVFVGAGMRTDVLWALSDTLLFLMLLCNTGALFCGRCRVIAAYDDQIGKNFSRLSNSPVVSSSGRKKEIPISETEIKRGDRRLWVQNRAK